MKFLKNNFEVLILVLFTLLSEFLHLAFVNIPFNENVNLDSPVYYLTSQVGLLTFIPSIIIFLLIPKTRRSSKGIAFGLVLWNLKEVIDEVCYIMKINNNVLELNGSEWMQISLIISIILLSWYGFTRWKS